jgi:hypothetical protein
MSTLIFFELDPVSASQQPGLSMRLKRNKQKDATSVATPSPHNAPRLAVRLGSPPLETCVGTSLPRTKRSPSPCLAPSAEPISREPTICSDIFEGTIKQVVDDAEWWVCVPVLL